MGVNDGVTDSRRRWLVLAIGLLAQTSSCSFLYGLAFLVPAMQATEGISLTTAGTMVAAPSIGLLLTLIAWGAAADRFGERLIMALGLGLAGLILAYSAVGTHSSGTLFALYLLAGAASASVNAASGRVVMGWFAASERGVAMGVRQTAQPIGVGLAALALPALAEATDVRMALLFPAAFMVLAAVLVGLLVVDPPRPAPSATATGGKPPSPYRAPALWRVHLASAALVVPQMAVSTFAPVYLVAVHGWSPLAAGGFFAAVQALGAAGRLATGYWSDRVGSRLRPMRQLAVASAAIMLVVALGDATWPWLVVVALGLAAVITVSDNGLGFTASAEIAGIAWSGRAMGAQNTGQNLASSLTPPLLGLVIGDSRYALAFGLVAVFPVVAIWLTPVRSEARESVQEQSVLK